MDSTAANDTLHRPTTAQIFERLFLDATRDFVLSMPLNYGALYYTLFGRPWRKRMRAPGWRMRRR